MKVELEELRAWVDGELNTEHATNIAAAVESDPELQKLAASLRASQLPYLDAFERTGMPALPDELAAKIDSTLASSQAATPRRTALPLSLAMTGMLIAAIGGYLLGNGTGQKSSSPSNTLVSNDLGSFSKAVAAYQALYVRETVAGTSNNNIAAVSARLLEKNQLTVQVPNLEQQGYQFIRAQQLAFKSQPLVQLIYLSKTGLPLALCYMPENQDELELTVGKHFGLQTAEWSYANKRFVLVSDSSQEQVKAIYQSAIDQWQI